MDCRHIGPGAILRALDFLDDWNIDMHSLLIAERGNTVYEAYWAPYSRETPCRMYSVTKSFVSLAVGALEHDGLLSLDDRIAGHFPEYSGLPHELDVLTIRNMLMMRTCHSVTTYKQGCNPRYIPSWKDDWVGSFFKARPDHSPGTTFVYDTSSSHVLASLVERLSGESFMEYLERKFGVHAPSYITKDPKGHPCGGSGLMMRPSDLMSLLLCLSRGMDGIIGKDYLEAALSPLSSIYGRRFIGYGYFFWILPDGYAMYGMGGQYAYYNRKRDIAVVTTAEAQGIKGGDDAILYAIESLTRPCEDRAGDDERLADRTASLHLSCVEGSWNVQPGRREYSFDGKAGLEWMAFGFDEGGGTVEAVYHKVLYRIPFGYMDNVIAPFPEKRSSPIASSAAILPDGSFQLVTHLLNEEIGQIVLNASFSGDSVTVSSHLNGEFSFLGFEGLSQGILHKGADVK